jgi:hypothetical protein
VTKNITLFSFFPSFVHQKIFILIFHFCNKKSSFQILLFTPFRPNPEIWISGNRPDLLPKILVKTNFQTPKMAFGSFLACRPSFCPKNPQPWPRNPNLTQFWSFLTQIWSFWPLFDPFRSVLVQLLGSGSKTLSNRRLFRGGLKAPQKGPIWPYFGFWRSYFCRLLASPTRYGR